MKAISTFIATIFIAFSATANTGFTPANMEDGTVGIGSVVFTTQSSNNEVLFSATAERAVAQGFHRLTITNAATNDVMISNTFAVFNWNTADTQTTTTVSNSRIALDAEEL